MALPTAAELKDFSYTFKGQPYVDIPSDAMDLTQMDVSFQGQPFNTNLNNAETNPTIMGSFGTILYEDISYICSTPIADVGNVLGLVV